jgi:Tol biopolymer transport system component/alpha-tubulin suppressor-like RCC1 family protein
MLNPRRRRVAFITALGLIVFPLLQSSLPATDVRLGSVRAAAVLPSTPVSVGSTHTLAIDTTGKLWSWGYNSQGQLGTGNYSSTNSPVPVSTGGMTLPVVAVAAGQRHSIAVDSTGALFAWGEGFHGALGTGTLSSANSPVRVAMPSAMALPIQAVAAGNDDSLAIDNNGQLWAWGFNQSGQLGNGNNTETLAPTPVVIPTGMQPPIRSIAAQDQTTYAIDAIGAVWSWGLNYTGALGAGLSYQTLQSTNVPVPVAQGIMTQPVKSVSAGEIHAVAIDANNQVYAWGNNLYGQVGVTASQNRYCTTGVGNSDTEYDAPVPVQLPATASAAGGQLHSLVADKAGKMWAWGSNFNGELGTNSASCDPSNQPVAVVTPTGMALPVSQVYAGNDTVSFALDANGHLWAWGLNFNGELGNCTNTDAHVPTPVCNLPPLGAPQAQRYVALGDSYSSGEGVPPFFAGTDVPDPTPPSTSPPKDMCHRSTHAYPELILNRAGFPSSVDFWACSGAVMRDFYQPKYSAEPGQLDHLNTGVTHITFSVGGNDIGFATIGAVCTDVTAVFFFQQNSKYQPNCGDFLDQQGQLQPNKLVDGLTTGIPEQGVSYSLPNFYSDIHTASPQARVYVIGYPNPLPPKLPPCPPRNGAVCSVGDCTANVLREDPNNTNGLKYGPGPTAYQVAFTIHRNDIIWMNKLFARLNTAIQTNALKAGFYFVDNTHTFDGHEVCASQPFVHGVVLPNNSNDPPSPFSFHPNDPGQAAMANQLAAFKAAPPTGGFSVSISPQQAIQQPLTVAPGLALLAVQSAWPGSDVQASLVSPSGQVFDRTTQASGLVHRLQSNAETYDITNPEAGQWTVKLFGANVPASGETVRVDTTQIPQSAFAPVAAMAPSTDRGVAPLTILLSAQGSSAFGGATIASYQWDFGDGSPTGSGANPSHVFSTPGVHTITVTVADSNGQSDTASQDVFVSATDQAPSASFIWGSLDSSNPTQVTMDARASADVDGKITGYSWDFGDGSTGSGVTAAHTFTAAGAYPVTLTVTDNGGLATSVCQSVTTGQFSGGPNQPCLAGTGISIGATEGSSFSAPVASFSEKTGADPAAAFTASIDWGDGSQAAGTVSGPSGGPFTVTGTHTFAEEGSFKVKTTLTQTASGATAAAQATASVQPRNGEILFSRASTAQGADHHSHIWLMNSDGTNAHVLTSGSFDDAQPVWSLDGTRIAFTSTRNGFTHIFVMNADGSGVTALTSGSAFDLDPAWAPDGSKIIFTSSRGGNTHIYVVSSSGGTPTALTSGSFYDAAAAWSPDGSHIAFTSTRAGQTHIFVMNPDGTGVVTLTSGSFYDATPSWSPDGSHIAIISNRGGNTHVYVMQSNGSGLIALTSGNGFDAQPTWSPDGATIVLISTRNGSAHIFVMNADGSGLKALTSGQAIDLSPSWRAAE